MRSSFLDAYRGLAVILMIVFHLCWDLRDFGFVEFSPFDDFWVRFRYIIVFLFLSAVGWSSYLAVQHQQSNKRFCFNQAKVGMAALIISLGSWLAVPNQWIYLGILQFICIAGFFVRPLSSYPFISFALGIILLAVNGYFGITPAVSHQWFVDNFSAPSDTLDYINPIPWLGIVLIGPIFGYFQLHKLKLPEWKTCKFLSIVGKNALIIYLAHQMVLYPSIAFVYFLSH